MKIKDHTSLSWPFVLLAMVGRADRSICTVIISSTKKQAPNDNSADKAG
jgi:hypothetical protein